MRVEVLESREEVVYHDTEQYEVIFPICSECGYRKFYCKVNDYSEGIILKVNEKYLESENNEI